MMVMSDPIRTGAFQSNSMLFEAWLQTDLQRLYDKLLDEPVPEELLKLVPLPQGPEPEQF